MTTNTEPGSGLPLLITANGAEEIDIDSLFNQQ